MRITTVGVICAVLRGRNGVGLMSKTANARDFALTARDKPQRGIADVNFISKPVGNHTVKNAAKPVGVRVKIVKRLSLQFNGRFLST